MPSGETRADPLGRDRHSAGATRKLVSTEHLNDLRANARHARERYQLYKARAYGQRPTRPERLRELQAGLRTGSSASSLCRG